MNKNNYIWSEEEIGKEIENHLFKKGYITYADMNEIINKNFNIQISSPIVMRSEHWNYMKKLAEENQRLKNFIISLVKEYELEEWLTEEHQEIWEMLNDKKEPDTDSETN